MANAWMVRSIIGGEDYHDKFLEKGCIMIDINGEVQYSPGDGYVNYGVDFQGKSNTDIRDILSDNPYDMDSFEISNLVPQLDMFFNKMDIGDLVLVPGNSVAIGIITGDCHRDEYGSLSRYRAHKPYGRSVNFVTIVSRSELTKKLRTRLMNCRQIGDLSDFYEEIEAISKGEEFKVKHETVHYSYPLRPNFQVDFDLPADMTHAEAKRLSQVVESIYFKGEDDETLYC